MYGNSAYMNMPMYPPPWMWPQGQTSNPPPDPLAEITAWQNRLDALKKAFKEEKKDDGKKKPEGPQPSIISMALFMILLSPITGPIMSKFFTMGVNLLPH